MHKYFYTFGPDPKYPYQSGWVEVMADDWDEADEKFTARFPNRDNGCVNCALRYMEGDFENTIIWLRGNYEDYCHEVLE